MSQPVRQVLLVVNRSQSVTSNIRATDIIGKIRRWLFRQSEGNAIFPGAGFQGLAITQPIFDPYLIELHRVTISELWEFLTTLDWQVFGVTLLYQNEETTATNSLTLGHRWVDIERRERIVRTG